MYNIILCCEHGASTSLVAEKIQEAANAKGVEAVVEAYSVGKLHEVIEKADVILLGPQIRFMSRRLMKEYADSGVPFVNIDASDFGRLNGEGIFTVAMEAIEK
nr:PTS sugar transporter subunit IIB [Clostridia bacterium]